MGAARSPDRLDDLVAAHPDRVSAVQPDVTDTQVGALEETTERELRDLFDLHFFGPAALTRAVLPHMRRAGRGAVVQMSSVGGRPPHRGSARTAPRSSRWKALPRP